MMLGTDNGVGSRGVTDQTNLFGERPRTYFRYSSTKQNVRTTGAGYGSADNLAACEQRLHNLILKLQTQDLTEDEVTAISSDILELVRKNFEDPESFDYVLDEQVCNSLLTLSNILSRRYADIVGSLDESTSNALNLSAEARDNLERTLPILDDFLTKVHKIANRKYLITKSNGTSARSHRKRPIKIHRQ